MPFWGRIFVPVVVVQMIVLITLNTVVAVLLNDCLATMLTVLSSLGTVFMTYFAVEAVRTDNIYQLAAYAGASIAFVAAYVPSIIGNDGATQYFNEHLPKTTMNERYQQFCSFLKLDWLFQIALVGIAVLGLTEGEWQWWITVGVQLPYTLLWLPWGLIAVRGSIDRSVSWPNGDPDAPPDAQNDAPADGLTSLRDVGSFDRDMDRDTDPYNGGGDGYSPRAARMLLALAADEGSPQQQGLASFYSTLPNLTQLSRGASLTERFDEMLKAYPAAASEQDADGNMPLHRSIVQKASERTILRLLKANPAAVSHPNHALDLPLHMAAENKPSDVVINRLVDGFPEGLKTQSGSGHVPSALAHDERVKIALERAKARLPKDEV
eukprot:jgi/Chrpa1/10832/Chrysochromulina_OHIO_Genome00017388-RA